MSSYEQPDLPGFELPSVRSESTELEPLKGYTFYRQGAGSNEAPIFAVEAEDRPVAYAAYYADCENRGKKPVPIEELSIISMKSKRSSKSNS